MFSNFKDTFIKKPQFTIKTPDAVLETISKDLPEGFSYVYDHDGFCRIECEREMTFTALNIKLPDEAKSVFSGIDYNIDDILKYAYNSQKTIEILPDDEGCYTINGNRINSQDFIVSPMSDKKLKNGKFYITPPPFPAPHPVEITGNGFSLILMIKRQPMNSINEIKYVTINEPALSITFSLDESQKSGIMNFNIMMCPSKSAQDTLAAKEIFNAFINGTGTLCGANIIPNGDHSSKMVSPEVLSFWHRVVELERKLNINFDVSQEITIDDVKTIDKLHKCIVESRSFKEYLSESTINGTGSLNSEIPEDSTLIGREMLFEFIKELEIKLLNATITCFALIAIFDGVASEIEIPADISNGEFLVKLISAEGKRMFSSTKYFLSMEELNTVRSDEMHFESMKNADELMKY